MRWQIFSILVLLVSGSIWASENTSPSDPIMQEKMKQFEASLKRQQGPVILRNGLARMNVPKQFHFLDHSNAVRVLELWGNQGIGDTLGMLLPSDVSIFSKDSWAVVIVYEDSGHVSDSDAKTIDYTHLLTQLQEASAEANKERKAQKVPQVELLGWATQPTYDSPAHKMFWAKELRFEGQNENTLNYNIRILGKEGVLVLNAVASMNQLPMIQKEAPAILSIIDFMPGNRYDDFKPGVDRLAGYGLAGLVAGGAVVTAAKAGFFKALIPILLGLKKFLILIAVAALASIKKLFPRKKSEAAPNSNG